MLYSAILSTQNDTCGQLGLGLLELPFSLLLPQQTAIVAEVSSSPPCHSRHQLINRRVLFAFLFASL